MPHCNIWRRVALLEVVWRISGLPAAPARAGAPAPSGRSGVRGPRVLATRLILAAGVASLATGLLPEVATAGPLPAATADVWANGGRGGAMVNSGTTSVPATETDIGTYGIATASAVNDPTTGPGVSVNVGTSINQDSEGVASATITYYYELNGPANLTGDLEKIDLTANLQTSVNHVGFTVSEAFAELYGSAASTSGATPYNQTGSKYVYAAAYSGACCNQFADSTFVSSVGLAEVLEVPVNTVEYLTLEAYATNDQEGVGANVTASIDPLISVDPLDPNARSYSITVSDGLSNGPIQNAIPAPGGLPLLAGALLPLAAVRLWSTRRARRPAAPG